MAKLCSGVFANPSPGSVTINLIRTTVSRATSQTISAHLPGSHSQGQRSLDALPQFARHLFDHVLVTHAVVGVT